MALSLAAKLVIALFALVGFWLWRINKTMRSVPPQAAAASPHRVTKEEVREMYEHVKKEPIDYTKHVPPKEDRRYIVVGGSGAVGGYIILQLLAQGHPPSAIRNIDFRPPLRDDLTTGDAANVPFFNADISNITQTRAAFAAPWDEDLSHLKLTVFHCAAVIRPSERLAIHAHRVDAINVDGTRNVIAAAKAVGASILVATSSASIACTPINFFRWPWQSPASNLVQVQDESDFDLPLKKREEYFANYAHSKARAERLVCEANSEGFRTGCVRPGNGVYGTMKVVDQMIGLTLRMGSVTTWIPHVVNGMVSSRNVALAHLMFERALLGGIGGGKGAMPKCAGRPVVVTDNGQPPTFSDFYTAATTLIPGYGIRHVSPVMMLMVAHIIEAYCWFAIVTGLPEIGGYTHMMQPSVFVTCSHCLVDDSQARKSVEEGGIGYNGMHGTLEGLCRQILEFNEEAEEKKEREAKKAAAVVDKL